MCLSYASRIKWNYLPKIGRFILRSEDKLE